MKKFLCLVLSVAMVLFVAGCKDGKNSPENQVISYNIGNNPNTLDPQIADDYSAKIVLMNIFEGLVRYDQDGKIVGGAAQKWEVNNDYSEYVFYLRDGVCWANNEKMPLKASDFVYGLQRAVLPETSSPYAKLFYCIKNAKSINTGNGNIESLGVKAVDDKTIKITLAYSNKDFLDVLTCPAAMPCNREFFNSTGGQYGLKTSMVMSNGPFKLKGKYGWDPERAITLARNPDYVGYKVPTPAGVSLLIGNKSENVAKLISNGNLDAGIINAEDCQIAQKDNMNLTSFEDTTWSMCFNLSDETMGNESIRKAFVESLDRNYVLSSLPENTKIANDIIMNSIMFGGSSYRDHVGNGMFLKQNADARNKLSQGLKQLNKKSLGVVTIVCQDDPNVKKIVNNMLELWNKNLGYYINMKPLEKSELISTINRGEYQIALAPISAHSSEPFDFLTMFVSDSKYNIVNMNDSHYDKILSNADEKLSSEAIKIYESAERYLNDKAIIYPMYYDSRYFASAKNVTGIIFYPYNKGIDFINATKKK